MGCPTEYVLDIGRIRQCAEIKITNMYFLIYVENYCSYALLNARNGKLGLLRIGAMYHFFFRDPKLESGEPLKVEKVHFPCVAVLYCMQSHSNRAYFSTSVHITNAVQ